MVGQYDKKAVKVQGCGLWVVKGFIECAVKRHGREAYFNVKVGRWQ